MTTSTQPQRPDFVPIILWTVLAILVLLFCLTSCTVKKHIDKTTVKSDSVVVRNIDSTGVKKLDSTGNSSSNSKSSTVEKTLEEKGIKVKFKADSTKTQKQLITITDNEDGSITIDPGGREVDELNYTNKKGNSKKKKESTDKKDSTAVKKSDSSHVKEEKKAEVKAVELHLKKDVERTPAPILNKLIIIGVIIILIILYVKRNTIKGWFKRIK